MDRQNFNPRMSIFSEMNNTYHLLSSYMCPALFSHVDTYELIWSSPSPCEVGTYCIILASLVRQVKPSQGRNLVLGQILVWGLGWGHGAGI